MSDYPSDWTTTQLQSVAKDFIVPMRDRPKRFTGSIPWIRIEDFTGKWVSRSQSGLCVDDEIIQEMNLKVHPQGSVLCSCSARLGVCAITERPLITNQTFIGIVPDITKIATEYLYYLMCSKATQLQALSSGTTIAYLPRQKFEEFEISIPPLPEQKKIAEILSGIDNTTKAIFKKKKKNDLILRQTIIDATTPHHASSWHESTIGDVVEFQGGAQPPRSTFKFAPEAGYIRMLQIRDYKSDARATYISLDLCKRFCDREDVMIGRYGPPNFQILRGKEGSYNVALIKTMPKDSGVLSKDYLYRFLQRGDLFVLMDTLSQRTSGQQGLDMDALKGFPMFIPDLATQDHICRSISAIESISLDLNARVQSLNHLKSGISGELLSGRKRVSV